jgi:hypothetical protein
MKVKRITLSGNTYFRFAEGNGGLVGIKKHSNYPIEIVILNGYHMSLAKAKGLHAALGMALEELNTTAPSAGEGEG